VYQLAPVSPIHIHVLHMRDCRKALTLPRVQWLDLRSLGCSNPPCAVNVFWKWASFYCESNGSHRGLCFSVLQCRLTTFSIDCKMWGWWVDAMSYYGLHENVDKASGATGGELTVVTKDTWIFGGRLSWVTTCYCLNDE